MSNIEYFQPISIFIILLGLCYYFVIKRTKALNNDPLQIKISNFFLEYAKGYYLNSEAERAEKDTEFLNQLTNFINEGVSDRQFAHSLTMAGIVLSENENCHLRSLVNKRIFRAKDAPEKFKESQNAEMLLNDDTVYDAIINERFCDTLCEIDLKTIIIKDYLPARDIPKLSSDGIKRNVTAINFFDEYQFLVEYNLDEILKRADDEFINFYNKEITFPYEYTIQFFDTFIVVTILPNTDKTEFVVISPSIENDFNGSLSSIYITSIMSVLSTTLKAQLELYLEVDKLLEYLRNDRISP